MIQNLMTNQQRSAMHVFQNCTKVKLDATSKTTITQVETF